jgi:uncharacterized protein YutE (UPF0331/DUF86 family)
MDPNEKILIKLREMNNYLKELEDILPETKKKYLQDITIRRACEKTIELAIECVIDIISIIVSHYTLGIPQSEDDLIAIVEKNNILDKQLSQKIKEMKGFRNILVHKYGEVDDEKSFRFLTEELGDFALFEREIKAYVRRMKEMKAS